MKKRAFIISFIICLIISLNCSYVSAYSGVTPSSYEVDFKPNLKQSFAFRFMLPEYTKAKIYVDGDLAKYVKLDKNSLLGGGVVLVLLELPEEIDTPGDNLIKIRAGEVITSEDGVNMVLAVVGVIKLKVPYPGKYAELEFTTRDVNKGEPVKFDLTVYSKGKEDIYATAYIDIYGEDKFIERLNLGSQFIESTQNRQFSSLFNTGNYGAGDYKATAIVEYGGENPVVVSKIFRLGKLFVDISNYTHEFERNKINRFVIETESFWNSKIENLYAEVNILGYDEFFKTPSTNLDPWKKTFLTGFFDTSSIKEDKVQANITLHYLNTTTSKIVDLKLKKEINYSLYIILAVVVVLVIILIWFLFSFLKRKYKIVKNESKKYK